MPVDVDAQLREAVEQLDREFASFINNIPVAGFLDPAMLDTRAKFKSPSPLLILQKNALPAHQKRKAKTVEKLEVKHTDTAKNLKAMRERYRNLQPTMEHFADLDDNSAEVRQRGALRLLRHIQAVATNEKDEVDEEHDVTEYCAKRLLRGCCKRDGGTRIGSALALSLLLKECKTLQPTWLLALARKILVSPKHSADKDVAWGKAFLYMALILSGRVFDRENCGRIVAALLDLRKFKHVRQLLAQLLGHCIAKCAPAVVVAQMWGRLKDALADPTGYTPELLYLALKLQAVFQSAKQNELPEALLKLLKTNFWDKVLLSEMRPSLVLHLFDQHPQVHIVWPAIITSVFTSSEDPARVAVHFKTMFQLLIEDTLREVQDQFRVIHAETEISVSIIAAIETLPDETVRNDLLHFLYNAKPSLVTRGLMRLVRSRVTPSQSVDGLIRQFWHVVELGPEDDENAASKRSYEEEVEELLALPGDSDDEEEGEGGAGAGGRKGRARPRKPVVRSFAGFRTTVQQYIVMALKLHAHEDAECLEQVIDFCMNNSLFCVPSNVDRREVLRRGDVTRVITAGLFNLLGSLLQTHTGQQPRYMHSAMELLREKEAAYEARYDALPEGSALLEARDAIFKLSARLQGLLPEKWDRAGVFTAHQALSRMLGFAFFYVTVIQDEGVPDLLLDLCQYAEANLQDLTTDMDTQIDLTLALLTYQVDFKAKCHDAAHVFRLLQQATLSLFRKTCAHLTQTGLSRIVDAFQDPMKVVEIGDTAEDDGDEAEMEDVAEGEDGAEGGEAATAKAQETLEEDDESDVDLDADMPMDIDETQMAMVLKAHQAVADRRKAEQERVVREEAIVKNIRLKMLDLASIYIEKCECSGSLLRIVHPVLTLMLEELKRIHGSKKSRVKREKRRLGPKDAQLYTKMRALLRDIVKAKPKPEEEALGQFMENCYAALEQCAKVVKGHDLGTEGSVMKGDFLICAVWAAGNLLRGREAGALEFDEDRIRSLFVTMLASKQVSMRTESVLKELLQRYLQRFGVVYIKFIIPALCEAVNRKAQEGGDSHPYTKLVVLKCLDTAVQYVLPKSAAHGAEHLTLLANLRTMMDSVQNLALNTAGIELLLNLTWHCLKWDRRRTVQPAATAIWKAHKDRTDHSPRSKLNLKLMRGVLRRAMGAAGQHELGFEETDLKRKVRTSSKVDGEGLEKKKKKTNKKRVNQEISDTTEGTDGTTANGDKKKPRKLGLYLEGVQSKKKVKVPDEQKGAGVPVAVQ